jgi:hypothetical protein
MDRQRLVSAANSKLSGIGSGTMSATLAGGQVTGSWAPVQATDPAAGKLAAQWDAVYGQGFFVANVLGNAHFCRAALSGAQGLHLDSMRISSSILGRPSRHRP